MNQHPDPTQTGEHLNAEQLLAGVIELTPEAREILTKQINQKIVWGYRITKTIFYTLSVLPLLVSAFFIYVGLKADINDIDWPRLITFVTVPALVAIGLVRLVKMI